MAAGDWADRIDEGKQHEPESEGRCQHTGRDTAAVELEAKHQRGGTDREKAEHGGGEKLGRKLPGEHWFSDRSRAPGYGASFAPVVSILSAKEALHRPAGRPRSLCGDPPNNPASLYR